ncbi:hypothetical protein SEVIR_6G052900v4 [Setaria viridis]|uniref:Uncharacterized protein n=1 Tax=Setaria viridis TaxID=4556 RepID=A0A4U6U5A1_SETVI|nr:uncharacterized protein LOC117862042 isoform X2 [Setaria viridis]TKW08863.1 hypothetical protein SEVIR_6G052900v2 [Setaria viridis]
MPSSSSSSSFAAVAAGGGGAIPSGPSSTLSPNAAPYTLLARQARAPPGRLQDGDASSLIDDNFVLNGEDNDSYSVLLATRFGMKPSDDVYPSCVYGIHKSQPSSSCGIPASVYPSPSSSVAIVSEPSVTIVSDFKQHRIPLTSGKVKVTIRSPPNKTSETDNTSIGSINKLAMRQNDESNKETGKDVPFRGNLEFSNPVNGNGTSQGTLVFSKELNPEFSVKPHGSSACSSPCVTVADDVNPDPSECSVDSPCWRGTASRLSPFDIHQTLVAQSVKQESVASDAGQEQSSSIDYLQNFVTSKSKQNHSQPHVESGLSKAPGDIGTNLIQDSHGKELEFVKHGAAKCNAEKQCSEVIDDLIKRSGLNSAAPDFIPFSVRKSNTSNGSCSSSGLNISGILKAIKSMSEVLCGNYSDEIEMKEHDYNLLQSVIENLQSCLHKARKVPFKGAFDKARGLKACYPQNAVSKSVTGNYSGSYTADNGKGIIISNLADSSRLLGDLRKKCMIGYQPSLNNFPKDLSCEEDHSQAIIYKNLWIDAERANCVLKYQLKQTCMEIDLESSRAHIGGGSRIPSFHVCDTGAHPCSSNGSAITSPLMLEDCPGGRNSHNLLYADHIQSGESSVLSSSKGHITVPKNTEDEYFLSGLEETGVHLHAHSGLQMASNRAHRGLDASTSDGMRSLSHITGRDGISCGSCGFGSSDWEHVLKEEIGST